MMNCLHSAEPFKIRIADDWSEIDWNLVTPSPLQSVPRFINLSSKTRNDLNVQDSDARNTLGTSFIAQLLKPDNGLSEVADVVIRLVRSKVSDGPAFSDIIVPRMK